MRCVERRRHPSRFPLEIRAARTPDAPALVNRREDGTLGSWSFSELDRLTVAVAHELRARGIEPGERAALRLAPGPLYPLLLLSLLRAGAGAVPVSTRLPAAAVAPLLGSAGCRRLITDEGAAAGGGARIDVLDAAGLLAGPAAPRPPAGAPLPPFDPTADATVVFTSGSSGAPKAALHTFANHWSSALGANRNIPLRPGDRWLLTLPLWHVGGLAVVFRCLLGGAAIAFPGRDEPLAAALSGLGATHVSLVGTQLLRLLREERGRAALRCLKAVVLGGGPLPEAMIEEALRAGVRLVTSYGLTESSSQVTATAPGDPPEALHTAGRTLAFRQLSVAADGEILVRGRTLFRGYVEGSTLRPSRNASGWFPTGDLGRLDTAGRLVVAGRRDAMFISGGENIHPEEIEREILRFPGVLEAIVVPVPDAEFGARPAAFLRWEESETPEPASLVGRLRETLPGFKVPVRFLPWPELPQGLKPDRRTLTALACPAQGGRGTSPAKRRPGAAD